MYLGISCLFIILGNFPRLIPLTGTFGSTNAGEIFIFLAAAALIPITLKSALQSRITTYLLILNSLSLIVGIMKFGFDSTAITYNIRLSALIFSSYVAGLSLYSIYKLNHEKLFESFVKLYVIVTFFGFILLAAFPDSTKLWIKLASLGVNFIGDPHQSRLISPYLDPNYFGTIIVLPIVISLFLRRITGEKKYAIFSLIMLIALALSFSRSGISLFVIIIAIGALAWATKISSRKGLFISKKTAGLVFIGLIAVFVFALFFDDQVSRLTGRFTNLSSDKSASSRLMSFETGFNLISSEPILGHGYNFSLTKLELKYAKTDSSMQVFIISYGILGALATAVCFLYWATKVLRGLKSKAIHQARSLPGVFLATIIYISASLLWAGNFNLIIFYPFWLFPILSILVYFEHVAFTKAPTQENQNKSHLTKTRTSRI